MIMLIQNFAAVKMYSKVMSITDTVWIDTVISFHYSIIFTVILVDKCIYPSPLLLRTSGNMTVVPYSMVNDSAITA